MGQLVKVRITATDPPGPVCDAYFNPKELQIDKQVSWTPSGAHDENPEQEFKEPQSATLSCTLFFDGYEKKQDVYDTWVSQLEQMVTMGPAGRPPVCLFQWGSKFRFQGVMESLSQKYTMFLEDGTRVRAEVAIKMKSAKGAKVATKK